jgi:hypothetical protein
MPVMRAVLEFDTKDGSAKISEVAGGFDKVGKAGKSAGDAIKNGFLERIGKASFDGLLSVLRSIPASFASSIQATIAYGGHLKDLEAKTGLSAEALQKLQHAAKLGGATLDDVTGAVGKMQQALLDSPEKFMRLGLSVADLRKMKPEEQFVTLAEKVNSFTTAAERTTAAREIFGKTGDVILQFAGNARAAMAEAEQLGLVMSSKTAAAADDLGDSVDTLSGTWDGLIRNFGAAIVTSEPLQRLIKGLTDLFGQFSKWVHDNQTAIRNWIDAGVVAGAHAFVEFINVIEAGMATLKAMADLWSSIKIASEVATKGIHADFQGYNKELEANQKALNDAVGGTSKAKAAFEQLEKVVAAGVGITHQATEEERRHGAVLGKNAADAVKEAKALKQYTLDIQDAFNQILKAEGFPRTIADSMKRDAEMTKLAAEATKDLADYWEELDAQVAKGVIDDVEAGTKKTEKLIGGIRDLAAAFDAVGGSAGSFVANGLRAFANLKDVGLQTASVWTKVAIAIQGAVAAYNAGTSAGTAGKGALAGAGHGAAAGASFGVPGLIVGAAIGAMAGYMGGKDAYDKQMQDLRLQFEKVEMQARLLGITFAHTFDPRNPMQYRAAIDEINKAMDTQAEAQQALDDAIQRYGFTIDELGPTFAKQKLDEQMAQIYKDWGVLTAAGVDHQAMLERIGPKVGELVDQYVSAGVEIPSAMKPIIDDLYEHHRLLHANGEEYTEAEYKGIGYAETMSQMFKDLITKVGELVDAINNMVLHDKDFNINGHYHPPAGLPAGVGDPGDPGARTGGEGSGGGSTPQERHGRGHALGLNRWVLPGEPAMQFAEAGRPEYVYASSNGPPSGNGGGGNSGPQQIVIPVSIGGEKLDTIIMRRARGGYIKVPA